MALILAFRCSLLIFLNFSDFPVFRSKSLDDVHSCDVFLYKRIQLGHRIAYTVKGTVHAFFKIISSYNDDRKRNQANKGKPPVRPNMMPSTQRMDSRSAMIGIRPSAKISLMRSISSMVRVVRVPIGVWSNWRRFRCSTFPKTFTRISFTTAWPSHDVI